MDFIRGFCMLFVIWDHLMYDFGMIFLFDFSTPVGQAIGRENIGTRTRYLPELVAEKLVKMDVPSEYVDIVMPKLSGFGNKDGKENAKGNYTSQIVFYAPSDIEAVALAVKEKLDGCADAKAVRALKAKDIQEAVKGVEARPITLDMALFGRMVTSNAFRDVEAAMQVAHAISTNKLNMETDFFTAMDDMLSGGSMEESGSGMMGDTDFNSSCYYIYASLDTDILEENLRFTPDSQELIRKAIPALVRTMALTNPSGKQNSFAGNVLPSAILVECKSEKVPVSMVNAFSKPVKPDKENGYDLIRGSIICLAKQVDSTQRCFGLQVDRRLWFCQEGYDERPESQCTVCSTLGELLDGLAETLE